MPEVSTLSDGCDLWMASPFVIGFDSTTGDRPARVGRSASWFWTEKSLIKKEEVMGLARIWFMALQTLRSHTVRPDVGGQTPSDLAQVSHRQSDIEWVEGPYGSAN